MPFFWRPISSVTVSSTEGILSLQVMTLALSMLHCYSWDMLKRVIMSLVMVGVHALLEKMLLDWYRR